LRLCSIDEVREGAPLRCETGGIAYAVFQLGDAHFVIADQCTHGPGYLSEGYEEDGQVECPFHSGKFDIRTGCPTAAPCTEPVSTWAVRVEDAGIWIQPGAGRKAACGT
jgi:nitrite reductase/ring-hydroxylating ferredoxin subunit